MKPGIYYRVATEEPVYCDGQRFHKLPGWFARFLRLARIAGREAEVRAMWGVVSSITDATTGVTVTRKEKA